MSVGILRLSRSSKPLQRRQRKLFPLQVYPHLSPLLLIGLLICCSLGVFVAAVSVECLAEERDLSCQLTLEEFEARCAPLVARMIPPVERCLKEASKSKILFYPSL
jgi:hypothetical protein